MIDLQEKTHSVDAFTAKALADKCQENGWLHRGGYDWQDDPYLEDYPYAFSRIEDMGVLHRVLSGGNWAIRQGFLYEDLAFIQQVNGGDEWWTLKKSGNDWIAFESCSFEHTSENYLEFATVIESMHESSVEDCETLSYMKSSDVLSIPPKSWQAEGLPEGWTWVEYHDGSGHLRTPDDKRICAFDLQTREFDDPYGRYRLNEGYTFSQAEQDIATILKKDPFFHAPSLMAKAQGVRTSAEKLAYPSHATREPEAPRK